MHRSEVVLMTFVGDVEMNIRSRKMVEWKVPNKKKYDERLISLRIIQENRILWLRSSDSRKCGLDIRSDRN